MNQSGHFPPLGKITWHWSLHGTCNSQSLSEFFISGDREVAVTQDTST